MLHKEPDSLMLLHVNYLNHIIYLLKDSDKRRESESESDPAITIMSPTQKENTEGLIYQNSQYKFLCE